MPAILTTDDTDDTDSEVIVSNPRFPGNPWLLLEFFLILVFDRRVFQR